MKANNLRIVFNRETGFELQKSVEGKKLESINTLIINIFKKGGKNIHKILQELGTGAGYAIRN